MSEEDPNVVEIKPSTEKVPDEYECGEASVHIFAACEQHFQNLAKTFQKAMIHCKYHAPDEHIYPLNSRSDLEDIFSIIKNESNKDKSALVVAFFGESKDYDIYLKNGELIKIKDISSSFVFAFRNKPRLFFMQGLRRLSNKPKRDSISPSDSKFDAPLEADQLVVFNTVDRDENINTFVRNIAKNIEEKGRRDDAFDIIMFSETCSKKRPLFLSTLRRKFYFKESPCRGFDYDFMKGLDNIEKKLSKKNMEKKITVQRRRSLLIN